MPRAIPAGLIAGALLVAATALAPPALAVEDPSRPDAQVTHGPSCHPGGLVVEVTAGTAPYTVRLASTRMPEGEDEAILDPAQTVVLTTGDVDWGETIDSRLEYAASDGSGVTYVDELEDYSFTRPTEEDCAAIAVPPQDVAPATPAPPPAPVADPAPVAADEAPPADKVPPADEVPPTEEAPAVPAGDAGIPVEDGAQEPPASADDDGGAVPVESGAHATAPVAAPATPLSAQVAPAAQTRGLTSWPVSLAGLGLLGSTTGLVLLVLRRWTQGRRRFESA